MKRKWLTVGIVFLFVGIAYAPAMAQNTEKLASRVTWLYVGGTGPGNYSRIQDAINDASDGDTVFVYAASSPYNEIILIDKSICLFGEKNNTTIIESNSNSVNIVSISADDVIIEGFTIRQEEGFWAKCIVVQANSTQIAHNIIRSRNFIGISLTHSKAKIVGNKISDNLFGIVVSGSNHTIFKNILNGNDEGVYIVGLHNTLLENIIKNNDMGIVIEGGSGNLIYHNYFMDNYMTDAIDYEGNNIWNGDFLTGGNYYSDFYTNDDFWGPNQDINGSDGIIDTPRYFPGDPGAYDYYPLKYPYGPTQLWMKFTPKTYGSKLLIRNFLSTTAFDVHWTLTLDGGKLICPREYSGGIKPIPPNEEVTILPGFFFFGFGAVEINVTVWAENTPTVTERINGFLFLFFFKVLKN